MTTAIFCAVPICEVNAASEIERGEGPVIEFPSQYGSPLEWGGCNSVSFRNLMAATNYDQGTNL